MKTFPRRKTRQIRVGKVAIGGGSPISIQSMTTTQTREVSSTVSQIKQLADAGCDLVRVTVPTLKDAESIPSIRMLSPVPIIADIHFDHRVAMRVLELGIDCLRINPGNILKQEYLEAIILRAKERKIPMRIGVNSGSLEPTILQKYGSPSAEALVESALGAVALLERMEFFDFKLSLKSSNVVTMIGAYRLFSEKVDYPLHLGVTEAGTVEAGSIKSAVGIGTLLAEGIGDTIRVSLTSDPVEEVRVAKQILQAAGNRKDRAEIVACPTCGRCDIDLIGLTKRVEAEVKDLKTNMTIALMGCVVNGPGEAREADIGIAAGKNSAVLFKKGKIVKRITEENIEGEILSAIREEARFHKPEEFKV
ncbi:MAG TPA: flavodoxin-dependent (E)-4-hydroxy-3-methylbut-2-enyl-diphosphate synthase [Bdellovibrionota bacterium]|nr:flavodoxin-dependent (E)-4-hydroxy-3-methylbut-2-enyl-diphosphate synthase [Bdellovibrionota bacterium]